MRTTLIFLVIIFFQTILWSQDNLWNGREEIILEYEAFTDTNFQYIIEENSDKIVVKIYGVDSLEITHFIRAYTNGEVDNESICDSLEIKLLCNDCVDYHVSKMINSKARKWKGFSDSMYISSKWVSKFYPADKTPKIYTVPILKVSKTGRFTQIVLYTEELTKQEWKEMKK